MGTVTCCILRTTIRNGLANYQASFNTERTQFMAFILNVSKVKSEYMEDIHTRSALTGLYTLLFYDILGFNSKSATLEQVGIFFLQLSFSRKAKIVTYFICIWFQILLQLSIESNKNFLMSLGFLYLKKSDLFQHNA